MKNEYLFSTEENRETIDNYKPEGVEVKTLSLENRDLWVATFSIPSENEESAQKLSDVHTYVETFSPTVITCESSAYFNRTLYPKVNEMERKLRKFLYIATSLSDNETAKSSITKLEEMDFGNIFDLLFIDRRFIENFKSHVNVNSKREVSLRDRYTKAELQAYLNSLSEQTLWDELISENMVSTLRAKFRDIHMYRNDVMHAHNISKEVYGKAQYVFKKVNQELDEAISTFTSPRKNTKPLNEKGFALSLSSALLAFDYSRVSDYINNIIFPSFDAILKTSNQVGEIIENANTNIVKNLASALLLLEKQSFQESYLLDSYTSNITKESDIALINKTENNRTGE